MRFHQQMMQSRSTAGDYSQAGIFSCRRMPLFNPPMIHRDFHRQRMMSYLRGQLAEASSRKDPRQTSPSLTLSRQCGSGTSRIGRALVEYLDEIDESAVHGWAFFDQSLIGKIIEENLLPETPEPYQPDQAKFPIPPLLRETLERPRSEWCLFNHSASTIRHLSRIGNSVIAGRAGNFVTSDHENTFHVRLVGSEAKRIAYTLSLIHI